MKTGFGKILLQTIFNQSQYGTVLVTRKDLDLNPTCEPDLASAWGSVDLLTIHASVIGVFMCPADKHSLVFKSFEKALKLI